jgi:hypothetical protein
MRLENTTAAVRPICVGIHFCTAAQLPSICKHVATPDTTFTYRRSLLSAAIMALVCVVHVQDQNIKDVWMCRSAKYGTAAVTSRICTSSSKLTVRPKHEQICQSCIQKISVQRVPSLSCIIR